MPISIENPSLSIVAPIFNEAGNVTPLINSIYQHCSYFSPEIIIVDDGSTDSTFSELESLKNKFSSLSLIRLKRNFGQTAALAAGIDHAKGDIIVTIDGDGQNDPEDIPRLVEKIREGFDVVSGWRKQRKDNLFSRKIPSWVANRLISQVTGVALHDYGCTLKAYRRSIITNLQLAGEMHRFLPAWCVWQGGKVTEIVVKHHPRTKGQSKYGMLRIIKVIIDLMTLKFFSGYLSKPNYLFSGSGLLGLILGFFAGSLAIFDKMGPDRFPQFRIPLLLLSVFLGITGILLVLMGLLAELLVRLYFEARHQRPYRLFNE